MATKRNAQEAFGRSGGKLSAVAAARLAKQHMPSGETVKKSRRQTVATVVTATSADDFTSQDPVTEYQNVIQPLVATRSKPLSSYLPQNIVRDDDSCFELVMKLDQSITLVGEYDLEVNKGVVTIYGAIVQQSCGRRRVYAPTTHALPQITARADSTCIKIYSVTDSITTLADLSPLFRGIWVKEHRSFLPIGPSDDDSSRSLLALEMEKDAQQCCNRLITKVSTENNVRIMTIGGKSSGKSTFNRFLCNSLLSRSQLRKCNYLDLDPGQPEFFSPGAVSLTEVRAPMLGPPVHHLATHHSKIFRLVRAHTLAATTFKDDPDHYLECTKNLVRHIDRSLPLIVNTCGWVSGLGARILADLVYMLGITDIVILDPIDDTLTSAFQDVISSVSLHRLSRRPTRPSNRTPAELRSMQTMSHFHHRPKQNGAFTWTGTPIEEWEPWSVSFGAENSDILATIFYGQMPDPSLLREVLDGSIVALVVEDKAVTGQKIETTQEGIPFVPVGSRGTCDPLNPDTSECVGLALIRAIDLEAKHFHLVTSLPEAEVACLMHRRVYLVRGSFDSPDWAYLESLYRDGDSDPGIGVRPWVGRREMVGVEGAVWRLRYPPMAATSVSR